MSNDELKQRLLWSIAPALGLMACFGWLTWQVQESEGRAKAAEYELIALVNPAPAPKPHPAFTRTVQRCEYFLTDEEIETWRSRCAAVRGSFYWGRNFVSCFPTDGRDNNPTFNAALWSVQARDLARSEGQP